MLLKKPTMAVTKNGYECAKIVFHLFFFSKARFKCSARPNLSGEVSNQSSNQTIAARNLNQVF